MFEILQSIPTVGVDYSYATGVAEGIIDTAVTSLTTELTVILPIILVLAVSLFAVVLGWKYVKRFLK